MSFLRLSRFNLAAGPGPTLCHGVATTNTDGPFKTRKFKLPKIPKDYHNHLPTADVTRLVGQAEEYLFNPQTPFRDSWPDFLKRCEESSHLFKPIDAAIVLRTIDERNGDSNNLIISKIMNAHLLKYQHKKIPGPALVTFFDIYAPRLPMADSMLNMLKVKIPEVMEELSSSDILRILECLKKSNIKDACVCKKVFRKITARISQMSYQEICDVSAIFGFHQFRNLELYEMILMRLKEIKPEFIRRQPLHLSRLFNGFLDNSIDSSPIIEHIGFNPPLPRFMKLDKELKTRGH